MRSLLTVKDWGREIELDGAAMQFSVACQEGKPIAYFEFEQDAIDFARASARRVHFCHQDGLKTRIKPR